MTNHFELCRQFARKHGLEYNDVIEFATELLCCGIEPELEPTEFKPRQHERNVQKNKL